MKTKDHHLICKKLTGIHIKGHNYMYQSIANAISPMYKAVACKPVSQLSGDNSKKQPDFYTEYDNQAFDLTISQNMEIAYKNKISKYAATGLQKPVIPIVLN